MIRASLNGHFEKKISRRGQQILEYAILIAALSTAFTVMYVYGKRGVQGIIKATTDEYIGAQQENSTVTDPFPAISTSSITTVTADTSNVRKTPAGITSNFTATSVSAGSSIIQSKEYK